jgi:hypothetical protein
METYSPDVEDTLVLVHISPVYTCEVWQNGEPNRPELRGWHLRDRPKYVLSNLILHGNQGDPL